MALVGFQYESVSLDVNKVCLMRSRLSLIHLNNQENVKALLNGIDVGHLEQWTQISSA